MEIRKLKTGEHGLTRSLYKEIFSEDSDSFVDYYYTEKTKDNSIYVAEEQGDIQAMLHLNPYTLMVNGRQEPSHYIVAVATRKEYRRRGYMAALLREALQEMYREGEPFTFLMPASESIYLPHGFRTVYEQEQRYGAFDEKQEGVRAAVEEDAEAMALFAEKELAENYQVYAKRTPEYYRDLISQYESDGGEIRLSLQDGRITDCRPFVPEPEEEKAKIMIRIVHVERLLQLLGLRSLMAACFQISDPLIEENNKCLFLTGTEFTGVMLMEGKPENSEGIIPIEALGSLVFGAKSPAEIAGEEGVEISERLKEELEKIIPLQKIFLNEIV